MSMRSVTVESVKSDSETVVGVKAVIQPPLELSQEAVSRFVEYGDLFDGPRDDAVTHILSPLVLGSSEEGTVIYAGTELQLTDLRHVKNLMGDRVVGLLNVMGVEAQYTPVK